MVINIPTTCLQLFQPRFNYLGLWMEEVSWFGELSVHAFTTIFTV